MLKKNLLKCVVNNEDKYLLAYLKYSCLCKTKLTTYMTLGSQSKILGKFLLYKFYDWVSVFLNTLHKFTYSHFPTLSVCFCVMSGRQWEGGSVCFCLSTGRHCRHFIPRRIWRDKCHLTFGNGEGVIPSHAKIRLCRLGHIIVSHFFVTFLILRLFLDFSLHNVVEMYFYSIWT